MNLDYPFQIDARGRIAGTGDNDHIRDLIEQLLFTDPGERVNRPDFGSGLRQLIFAPNSQELAAALQFTMRGAILRWLGDLIDLNALEVQAVDATLSVLVSYTILRTGERRTDTFEKGTP
ncbi:MAG TPA: GPW/gp25 family protein [Chthoniobacteraceae bacterium]|jgi:phage baseplate assembly protein W|nr:GPW/gp25 family protein [Chthoniobacteraceae bacterium]